MASYSVDKLVPKLKFKIRHRPIKLSQPEGPLGRLKLLRKTVTALFKHERIELNFNRATEARGYAERLITEAIRNGDCHRPTMEMADFWLEEKQLIHKLFKVLVPRYKLYDTAYTKVYQAPAIVPGIPFKRAIIELKGNPFPPVIPHITPCHHLIHNILLEEAKKESNERSLPDKATGIPEEEEERVLSITEDKQLIEKLGKLATNED